MKTTPVPADTWFVAYDISDPRRLRRVHRCIRREGIALQYSGFAVNGDARRLETLMSTLQELIDPKRDDIRAYHLPVSCQVWSVGKQSWPDDITFTGAGALSQLLATVSDSEDDNVVQESHVD